MQPNSKALFKCLWVAMILLVLGVDGLPDRVARPVVVERDPDEVGFTFALGHSTTLWSASTAVMVFESGRTAGSPAGSPTGTGSNNTGMGTPVLITSVGITPTTTSTADYMAVVSTWRARGGLPALAQDNSLEANALKTSTDSVDGLKHELNAGTMAQVLAPGTPTDFEDVYVGGWLCEIPSLPGLDGICETASQGWSYDGQTGHAQILTSTGYTRIGCAIASNTQVWACDLA